LGSLTLHANAQSIALNGEIIFDRVTEGRFPEVKEIKQMIRDHITPEKDLGHSDVKDVHNEGMLDEDEAAEARKFFGVD
jgi:predicted Rdx family selenoprotein